MPVALVCALQKDYLGLFHDFEFSYLFAMWCIRFVWLSSMLYCLTVLKPSLFTNQGTSLISGYFCILGAIRFNFLHFGNKILAELCLALLEYWLPLFFIIMSWWFYKLWLCRKDWTVDDYSCLLYCLLILFLIAAPTLYGLYFRHFTQISSSARPYSKLFNNYVFTIANIIMSVIPGQIVKYNVIASKDHIIATKQAYVRYISHELRTPMSIIQNGLQYCISKIPENTTNVIKKQTREMLIETDMASRVALEILNDLLLYDKLENGLIKIKQETVGVIDFVSQCVKTFAVQIRAKGLHFTFVNQQLSLRFIQ